MAAKQEYGSNLQNLFCPLITGVGPIEAAVTTSANLARLEQKNQLPDLVVSLGSAGSRTLKQTEVYQASEISYRDMDASALGFEKGVTPFLDLPHSVKMSIAIDGLPKARLSTGANIVSGDDYNDIEQEMVDMESYAIMRSCQRVEIPLLCLRGISDGADELHQLDDWTLYLQVIDEKLANIVRLLEAEIASGSISF